MTRTDLGRVFERDRALEVAILWGDESLLSVDHLPSPRDYYVGDPSHADVDFILGSDAIGTGRLPLCVTRGKQLTAVVPKAATGEITIDGRTTSIGALRAEGALKPSEEAVQAEELPLPLGSQLRMKCGDFTFVIRDTDATAEVAGPAKLELEPVAYVAGVGILASLVLTLFYFQPPRPRGLVGDIQGAEGRLIDFVKEIRVATTPELLGGRGEVGEPRLAQPGSKPSTGDPGRSGDPQAMPSRRRTSTRGRSPRDARQSRGLALASARRAGVIGVLERMGGAMDGSRSPFGAGNALGRGVTDALGLLTGVEPGQAQGWLGMGPRDTGRGAGGDASGTIGSSEGMTIPRLTGGPGGPGGVGNTIGVRSGRHVAAPRRVRPRVSIHGEISKEAIRRVVRRHRNEIKHCYEQALNARPDLRGRVEMMFVISPTGSVQSATVADSSLGNRNVEQCVARAIRRWTFPMPDDGGVVSVRYPFMFESQAALN